MAGGGGGGGNVDVYNTNGQLAASFFSSSQCD